MEGVYRFLAPFVDTTKPIYVSLDGQAAEMGVHIRCDTPLDDSQIPNWSAQTKSSFRIARFWLAGASYFTFFQDNEPFVPGE